MSSLGCFILLITFEFCIANEDVVVTTKNGKILGKVVDFGKDQKYYSFQSIPYAQPPLDDLRFKAPVPSGSWKNVLNATTPSPMCPQNLLIRNKIVDFGQEDCLYLNVYTPMIPDDNHLLLPVMVYIHGGAFIAGSSHLFKPDYLLTDNVMLVTINYRLGLLGFLNFPNPKLKIPGNAGLKDQVLALKWVQDNIKNFKGDPKNVTIFGQQAGAASVHLHVLSPKSKGLFNKAIAQSGTALNYWVIGKNDNGKVLSQALNISTDNDEELMEDLKKIPQNRLLETQMEMLKKTGKRYCCVVLETHTNRKAFLIKSPMVIIKSGNYNKVPLLLGYNSQEGLIDQVFSKLTNNNYTIIQNFEKRLPYDLRDDSESVKEIAEKVNKFYYKNVLASKNLVLQPTINFDTDTKFFYHIYQAAIEHTKASKENVYFYRFSADTKLNIWKYAYPELASYSGATNGDELQYLFNTTFAQRFGLGQIENVAKRRLIRLWTNFAKFGNPTVDEEELLEQQIWKAFSPKDNNILEIGNNINASTNPDLERYVFWENIYETYS